MQSDRLRSAFTEAVFDSDAETIGEAMLRGHQAAADADAQLHRVYMLLGDPALRLRAPKSDPRPGPGPPDSPPSEAPALGLASGCEIEPLAASRGPLGPLGILLGLAALIRRRRT